MTNRLFFLEIAIPTYNRCDKLNRLLLIIEKEIESIQACISIRITISDNCSTDGTKDMLRQHSFRNRLNVHTNTKNVGALRNIWGLYEVAQAEYIWIISDDDIPKPGSLLKIIDILVQYKPTVLTFEFEQPPGTSMRRHGNRQGIEVIGELKDAIPNILVLGKLTKQVFSTKDLKVALQNVQFLRDTGYGWLYAVLEIIKLANHPKIVICHDFLASCDEDYLQLTEGLIPQYWDDFLLLLDHEIVKANCPDYVNHYRNGHNRYMVLIIYGALAGPLKGADSKIFRNKGKQIPFSLSYLRNPFILLQWISLRLDVPVSKTICYMAEYLGKVKEKFLSLTAR